jgi:hypothetical protein
LHSAAASWGRSVDGEDDGGMAVREGRHRCAQSVEAQADK